MNPRLCMKLLVLACLIVLEIAAAPFVHAETALAAASTERQLADAERAATEATRAYDDARAEVAELRAAWDAAVAGGHPVPAGRWARLHFEAVQRRNAAHARWQAALARTDELRSQR